MDYSKKMMTALEDTVFAYEKAIEYLENGSRTPFSIAYDFNCVPCRFCDAADYDYGTSGFESCKFCILFSNKSANDDDDDLPPCVTKTFDDRDDAIDMVIRSHNWYYNDYSDKEREKYTKKLISALKARVKWIIKRAEKNGVVLVERSKR